MEYKINLEQEWTPETFAEEMRKIQKHYFEDRVARGELEDPEDCHWVMDCVMVNVLDKLGFGEGAYVFANTKKWCG